MLAVPWQLVLKFLKSLPARMLSSPPSLPPHPPTPLPSLLVAGSYTAESELLSRVCTAVVVNDILHVLAATTSERKAGLRFWAGNDDLRFFDDLRLQFGPRAARKYQRVHTKERKRNGIGVARDGPHSPLDFLLLFF